MNDHKIGNSEDLSKEPNFIIRQSLHYINFCWTAIDRIVQLGGDIAHAGNNLK